MKKLRRRSNLLFLLLSIMTLSGCSKHEAISITYPSEMVVIEYGTSIEVNDLVIWGNYDSLSLSSIDTMTLGIQDVTLTAVKGDHQEKHTTTVEIVDTRLPWFTKKTDQIEITQNDALNISAYFEAKDEIDGALDVELSSALDTSTHGTHTREVIAKDFNGNEVRTAVTIIIKEIDQAPKPSVDPDTNHTTTPPASNASNGSSSSALQAFMTGNKFLFVDYADNAEHAKNACLSHLTQNSLPAGYLGVCDVLKDDKGILDIGYIAKYIKQ